MRIVACVMLAAFAMAGCCRSGDQVWDDTKTAGRHVTRGVKSLGGKHGDSRQVCCREDFIGRDDGCCDFGFEPLPDQEFSREVAMADTFVRQPKQSPGDPGSKIPGIEAFKDPAVDPETRNVFVNILFPLNSNLIKGKENLDTARKIAEYMKKHDKVYLYVEGHCDERGAEAYNLALGARRCNAVRNYLVKEGVDPDRIFTVSYGKERPSVDGHNEDAWAKNRRAEFKIYVRDRIKTTSTLSEGCDAPSAAQNSSGIGALTIPSSFCTASEASRASESVQFISIRSLR